MLLRGVGWFVAVVLITAIVGGWLDWRFHLPSVVRALFLVGGLSAAGVVAFRYLLCPLLARADDLTLALRVEERYPSLNDALASTVQFLDESSDSGRSGSPYLRRVAVQRALRQAEGCDFNRIIDRRGVRAAGVSLLASSALAAVLVLLDPAQAWIALQRLTNPFGGSDWPRQTGLELDPHPDRIARNEPFEVRGRVQGVIPERATVCFRFDGGSQVEHSCAITRGENADIGTFQAKLESGRVQRDFEFQVRAHDAVTDWHPVAVLPPPLLVSLDGRPSPQVHLQYPAYTDLLPYQLPDGVGNIETVAGTLVTLRAAADRPLAGAWVQYLPEQRFTDLAAALGPLGGQHPAESMALTAAGQAIWDVVPARLDSNRRAFTVSFLPRVSGMYALHFRDESGLPNSRLFELRVALDPTPAVNLERPSPSRDNLNMLPGAEVTLQVAVEDPLFAIRSVYLEYRCKKSDLPRRLPLYDHRSAGAALAQALASLTGTPLTAHPLRLRPQRMQLGQRLPLSQLKHLDAVEPDLREGDVITLQVCADDFDDVAVDKEPGRSHEVEIRIVNRNALDVILNQEQAKVQQELVRLREQQREALQKVNDVDARLNRNKRLEPEDVAQVLQAEQIQQQIRERVGTRQEGLRADVRRILETLRDNKVPRSATHERMEAVASELERLAREELGQIEPRLTNARKRAESPEEKTRDRDRRARMLETLAQDRERDAVKLEQLVRDKPEADPDRAAAQAGARQLRQQAQQLRAIADAVRKNAEDQPNDSEARAQVLEGAAQERQSQADRLEELARDRPDDHPEKAAAEDAAKRLRQQADELRELADSTRHRKSSEEGIKDALDEARRHQEEVEKTLTDLLARLEPWTSTREIKGEAKSILQEQRRLADETQTLQERGLTGQRPDQLSGEQRADLEKARQAQEKLQERTAELLGKMQAVAEDRKEKDPETARELQEAHQQAVRSDITGQMREAAGQIERNQLNQAGRSQRASAQKLQELVQRLEDRREAELDRLVKKLREAEQQMDDLIQRQEELQKKVKDAAHIADAQQREAELQRLAREQRQLREEAQEMARQLSRLRAERAGQALSRAGGQMERAGQQMDQGQNAEDQQEEALDRLDDARQELERAREEAEEELAHELLGKVADVIKRLQERQEALNTESARIQRALLERKRTEWRSLLLSLGDLSNAQKGLGEETAALARERLTGAPVFARILSKSADAMEQSAQRFLEHRKLVLDKDQAETDAGQEAVRLQQDALRRLSQLLDALKEEEDVALRPPRRNQQGGGEPGGQEGGGRPGDDGDAIPELVQLKLLRSLQAEVNQRTEEFSKQHPDADKLNDAQKAELQALRRDQQEVADLLDELTRPATEGEKP